LTHPEGGYFDRCAGDLGFLKLRLLQIEGNGAAGFFFLDLAQAAAEPIYREAARWALDAFVVDVSSFGIHAASYGLALDGFLSP
jgi:hypothetical protein